MKAVSDANPNDNEVKIFYALSVSAVGDADGQDVCEERAGGRHPRAAVPADAHAPGPGALHHPRLRRAAARRQSARRRAQVRVARAGDPARTAHAVAHLYARRIVEGIDRDQQAVGRPRRRRTGGVAEELHALDYQTYAYLQTAQDKAAKAVVDEAAASPMRRRRATADGGRATGRPNTFAIAAIPARYALERGDWAMAATLDAASGRNTPYTEAITHFARAIGAARSGNPAAATADIEKLAALRDNAEVDARTRTGPSRSTFSAASRWRGRPSRRARRTRGSRSSAPPPMPRTRPTSRPSRPGRSRRRASCSGSCCSTPAAPKRRSSRSRRR